MRDTIERGEMWTHSIVSIKPLASSAIMTNNLMVSFSAFAGGVLAGLGTVYLLFLNGVLISVISIACARAGMGVSLWSFVAPHGALELPAIFIAGGAGLLMAKGLLAPGYLTRRESLTRAAALAIKLLLGAVPLLVVAGIIEGFISPSDLPVAAKFAIGASMFVLLAGYVTLADRRAAPHGLQQVSLFHAEIAVDDRRGQLGGRHFDRQRAALAQVAEQHRAPFHQLLRPHHPVHVAGVGRHARRRRGQFGRARHGEQQHVLRHHARRALDHFRQSRALGDVGHPYDQRPPLLRRHD